MGGDETFDVCLEGGVVGAFLSQECATFVLREGGGSVIEITESFPAISAHGMVAFTVGLLETRCYRKTIDRPIRKATSYKAMATSIPTASTGLPGRIVRVG